MNGKKADLSSLINEFKCGYNTGKDLFPAVTVIGSARMEESNHYYQATKEFAYKISNNGINVITGGGGGIMEAANRGAYESKKTNSVGFSIVLPKEQKTNPYVTKEYKFDHFYSRKYMLFNFCEAVVVFPGGFGTLDELFELLVLLQTQKLKDIAIYMYDEEFWQPMIDFIKVSLLKNKTIDEFDLDRFVITNSIDEIVQRICSKI